MLKIESISPEQVKPWEDYIFGEEPLTFHKVTPVMRWTDEGSGYLVSEVTTGKRTGDFGKLAVEIKER